MRLERKAGYVTGIKCDCCGLEHEDDFNYCSADIRLVEVKNNRHAGNVDRLPVTFSIDMCMECAGNVDDLVKLHYKATGVGVNCDLCGAELRGDFIFYYIIISKVDVRFSAGAAKCRSCGALVVGSKCKCGGVEFVQAAAITVDDKYRQVMICQGDYDGLTGEALKMRQS